MRHQVQIIFFVVLLLLAGCSEPEERVEVTAVPPTPTSEPTPVLTPETERDFIVVATDAPRPPFALFDDFGVVDGFDSRILENIASDADLAYELIVTPYEGVLANIANPNTNDFDAVIANLIIPEQAPEGIVYTDPYLEVGQVLVVLADNDSLQSYRDIAPGLLIGVVENSYGAEIARELIGVGENDLVDYFQNGVQALQALIDEGVTAVIVDSTLATFYAESFPNQLKIVGGNGRESWISHKAYGIALSADNQELLERLNQAIANTQASGDIEREIVTWLIPKENLDPGESRVGTPTDELFIGILGQLNDMDPASQSDLIGWEVKSNTMSGLYSFSHTNELVPMLAEGMPTISADGLEYTIQLRTDLRFPDGSDFTAVDVKWSIDRARSLGSFTVNSVLKDSDSNFYADNDAVQVIDPYTVKFVLQEPTSHFPALLATPPYFPISSECYSETVDNLSVCGGIGPYTIVDWVPGDRMRLRANPEWPGQPAPAFANITLRFYADADSLRRSLVEFGSIDLVWRGLPYTDFLELQQADSDGNIGTDFKAWVGPADFKSYLMFNHTAVPWNSSLVRQAVALSVDREFLASDTFGGSRLPLYSPVPDGVAGHLPVLPQRNLIQARTFLAQAGYSEAVRLPIELWYVSDGRYSPIEEAYATAIKTQLEETGVFDVSLLSAPFEQFRAQIAECAYPAYLIGWPSPGRPVDYLDVMAWTEFFVTSNSFCNNYDSPVMEELVTAVLAETDPAARQQLYQQFQQKWAADLPTLELLQQYSYAISLNNINNVAIDALGLMHYEVLTKGGG